MEWLVEEEEEVEETGQRLWEISQLSSCFPQVSTGQGCRTATAQGLSRAWAARALGAPKLGNWEQGGCAAVGRPQGVLQQLG